MKNILFLFLLSVSSIYSQNIILSHSTNESTDDVNGDICNISSLNFKLLRTNNAAFYTDPLITTSAKLYRNGKKEQNADQFFPDQQYLIFSSSEGKSGTYKAIIKHSFLGIPIKTEESNEIKVSYTGSNGSYNALKTIGRLITSDFDNTSGTDVTAMYDYYGDNKPALHMWLNKNYSELKYQGDNGWLKFSDYNPSKVTSKIVKGDFDNDGKNDDIAGLYDYGNNQCAFHIYSSNGLKFNYQGDNGFWNSNSYNANKVTGRMVSGDFDNDGVIDDIASLYDYGDNSCAFHLFLSDGTKFTYQGDNGFWHSNDYNPKKITDRIVSGDFDNDGFLDDIACLYDYGSNKSTFHVFLSDGTKFIYQGDNGFWNSNSYNANNVTGRVVSADFDNDGFVDDIAVMYDYGNSQSTFHIFLSDGSQLNYQGDSGWLSMNSYNAKKVTGIGTGNFDANGFADIITMYDYGCNQARIHTFLTNNNNITFQNSLGWWQVCNDNCK